MHWADLTFVAFDTETTGLSPHTGDRIIEVGIVSFRCDRDGRVVDQQEYGRLINPEIPIPKAATEVSKIRDEDVADAPVFADLAEEVAAYFVDAVAVAHNYPFDHAFLTTELARVGVPWIEPLAAIDTVDLSRRRYPDASSHRLEELARRTGVSLKDAHRAVHDARACGECLFTMLSEADVEGELDALLAWSGGLGRPPRVPGGWLGVDEAGVPVFVDGPHVGERIDAHPLHLAWMTMAKARKDGGWIWRFDAPTRHWARHFLNVRTTGRAKANLKSYRAQDWALDSCIAEPRVDGRDQAGTSSDDAPVDHGPQGRL